MRVLLAIPCGDVLRCRWDIKIEEATMKYYPFPVRLAYATALLKENGIDAHIIDGTAEELTTEQFVERVMDIDPDLLVWETTASSFDYDLGLMTALKAVKPELQVAASGYHATPAWRGCLDAGYDYVIVGDEL